MNKKPEIYTLYNLEDGSHFGEALGVVDEDLFIPEGKGVYRGTFDWKFERIGPEGKPIPRETDYRPDPNASINRERNKRLETGKDFGGVWLQCRDSDIALLTGLSRKAERLKAQGIEDAVILFKDGKNVEHTLTPDKVLELEDQSMEYVSAVAEASWALKKMDPVPADLEDDQYWPDRKTS